MEFQPWEDHEHNQRKVQQREMRLPPHLQMFGNKLLLRDCYLAMKLLADEMAPLESNPLVDLERRRLRSNQRKIAQRKAKVIESQLQPETIEACKSAANELFGIEVKKRRAVALKNFKPGKKTVSDEAWRAHYSKAKKDRESAWKRKYGETFPGTPDTR